MDESCKKIGNHFEEARSTSDGIESLSSIVSLMDALENVLRYERHKDVSMRGRKFNFKFY